ncbi:signal peptidase complex subunit 1-like [Raphidocelis subcapitata]|uniref:Signal peptidase complex subunit 1 n=1 Tax=Raphidocelis subcapitata TaxID=307507 RepID=A0A2V0P9E3_9CHLO|nr:signal peptidase complex subunit 1-like [Raphidocelis subcapitata]|eukprot:GBF93787.1 signal peptidase complex subunit 1-like [Raphidocelis subcapitata]
MDYEGQKQSEALITRLLVLFAAIGFLGGYAVGSFSLMVAVNAAGLAITLLLVVPDWPWFNRNPLSWLPPLYPADGEGAAASGGGGAVVVSGGGGDGAGSGGSGSRSRGAVVKR